MKFPTLHIATSTVNRILNIADEIDGKGKMVPVPLVANPPQPTDPTLQGVQLNAQLSQPVQPVDADPATAQALTLQPLLE